MKNEETIFCVVTTAFSSMEYGTRSCSCKSCTSISPSSGIVLSIFFWITKQIITPFITGSTLGSNAEAYRIHRQGERTLVDPQAGLAAYHLSERTLIDPQAGLAIYLNSERTRVPALFTPYQQSEWFGQ